LNLKIKLFPNILA